MTANQVKKYLDVNQITDYSKFVLGERDGQIFFVKWEYELAQPTEETLPTIEESNTWVENERQLAKGLELKQTENNFLLICDQLTQTNTHTKLDFPTLNSLLDALLLIDANTAIVLSLKLLAIDAQGKTLAGLDWWSDCTWHADIV